MGRFQMGKPAAIILHPEIKSRPLPRSPQDMLEEAAGLAEHRIAVHRDQLVAVGRYQAAPVHQLSSWCCSPPRSTREA